MVTNQAPVHHWSRGETWESVWMWRCVKTLTPQMTTGAGTLPVEVDTATNVYTLSVHINCTITLECILSQCGGDYTRLCCIHNCILLYSVYIRRIYLKCKKVSQTIYNNDIKFF